MSKEKISGIYKITAKHNGKVYIGQSNDIYNRWKGHWKQVKAGSNTYLHNTMRKYGKNNFIFEIIEECGQDTINEREIYWISYYDSFNNGFNLTIGGEGVKGKVFTEEEKENQRQISIKKGNNKPLLQFDLEGNFIKEWVGAKTVNKQMGYSYGSISSCTSKKEGYKTAYGFIWVYKDDFQKNGLDLKYYLDSLVKDTIYQIDNKNNIVKIWDNSSVIDKRYKLSPIYQCLDEKYTHHKTAYGYVWVYKRNYDKNKDYSMYFIKNKTNKIIYQYSKSGKFIKMYNSIREASIENKINESNIGQCARHKQNSAGGFIWLFEKDINNINDYVKLLQPKERKKYQKNYSLSMYKKVRLIDKNGAIIKEYNNASEAAKDLGLHSSCIHKVCKGERTHTCGYIFEYFD